MTAPEPSATQYVVGPPGCGAGTTPCLVAYVASDGSLHALNGGVPIYETAAHAVDLFSPLSFSPSGSLYFFQYVKSQGQRGILYRADLSRADRSCGSPRAISSRPPVSSRSSTTRMQRQRLRVCVSPAHQPMAERWASATPAPTSILASSADIVSAGNYELSDDSAAVLPYNPPVLVRNTPPC